MQKVAPPGKTTEFKYVFIPADNNEPIEERNFPQVDLEDDRFIKMIKAYFSQANPESGVDRDLLIKQMSQHAKRDITDSMDTETLNRLLSVTSVDIMSIALPSVENGHVGVSLYCDDKGKSKNLQENHRAGGLVAACGLVGQTLDGDVFLSRMYDDGDENWFRLNFGLVDVSSSAPWVMRAAEQANRKLTSGPTSLSGLAEQFFSNAPTVLPELQNAVEGGSTEEYRWTQSSEEVEVTVKCGERVTKANVSVLIKQKSLKVKLGDSVIIDGELPEAVDPSDSTWTFSSGDKMVQITLIKKMEGSMWKQLLKP